MMTVDYLLTSMAWAFLGFVITYLLLKTRGYGHG